MIIYKTTNLINNKFYVGKDKYNNPLYLGSGKILKEAIKKYGKGNFIKEVLEVCKSIEEMNERETFWIKELNAINVGYNIALGGEGGDTISNNPRKDEISKKHSEWLLENNTTRGRKKTEEEINKWRESYIGKYRGENNPNYGSKRNESTKKKISESRKKYWNSLSENEIKNLGEKISKSNKGRIGRKLTEEEKLKHSEWMRENNPMKGKTHTDEVKKFLSNLNKKPKQQETKEKISNSLKKYQETAEKPKNTRKFNIDGKIYLGYNEASKDLNIPVGTIRNRLKSDSFDNYFYID